METVDRALTMASDGMSTSAIAREIGVARATVRDWRAGRVPRTTSLGEPWNEPGFAEVEYSHLLGLYLGDDCISHAPRTTVLRIFFDAAYRMATSERPQHRDDSAERGGAAGRVRRPKR